ncbi:hypothetical protein D187_009267 [Cystobacter fuscus DSM 2262]|uniref:PAC domain-containing protein n=1 Tax=Cystobacter fuscus (strain ATCC 25194 / DSM 2262 / NBRC 100088 / M29) TaxID=1242864 RepID=S9NXS5_CYSF2|nr:PAS domain-containing protein [Cystobacter fuscus]EPX55656.1 hypothetical protein D187_009267 [Cystobacter fuscus DSM 2262]
MEAPPRRRARARRPALPGGLHTGRAGARVRPAERPVASWPRPPPRRWRSTPASKRARREEGRDPRRHRFPGEEERARLNAAFLQAPVAIGIIRGQQMVIDLANPQFCRFCGRLPEQVVGKPLLEALPELEGVGLDDLIHEVMTTGVAFVAKEQAVRLARGTDGALETAYFNIVYDALRDERGHIEGVITVATEVTEGVLTRQQVETLLQRTQESEQARAAMMDALAAQTLVAVCYLRGPDHVFETANPVYHQLVGRDVVGMKALEALPELASLRGDGAGAPATGGPTAGRGGAGPPGLRAAPHRHRQP